MAEVHESKHTVKMAEQIAASPETVREALTDPLRLRRWWASWTGCAITAATIDARRGGLYRIESATEGNTPHFIAGEVLHLTADLIAITWSTEQSEGFASTVYFSIGAAKGGTALTVEHRDLQGEDEVRRSEQAWTRILAIMKRGVPHLDETRVPPEVDAFLRRKQNHPALSDKKPARPRRPRG